MGKVSIYLFLTAVTAALIASCSEGEHNNPAFLGSAEIESTTFTVATSVQGILVAVMIDEGTRVTAHEIIAIIDTIPLQFSRQEIAAGIKEINATVSAQKTQIEALEIEVDGLGREFSRIDGLVRKGAAPPQQRDNLSTQLNAAKARLAATRSGLQPLIEKEKGLQISIQKINDQIRRCYITSPANGIILTRYHDRGEVAGIGTPVADIGIFDTMYADFFVPQPVVSTLSYEKPIQVRIDWDSLGMTDARYLPGMISWIGEEAEFTPKNIQTRQSRNELVFRIRCIVPNPSGILKRGLPVEIWR